MTAGPCRLDALVALSNTVRTTSGRLDKRDRIAEFLRTLSPADVSLAASYASGEIPQGAVGVGPGTLRASATPPAELPLFKPSAALAAESPTLVELDILFDRLRTASGPGAERTRVSLLAAILPRLAESERAFLIALLFGELRQGALRALVIEAVAAAFATDAAAVRRAVMFAGEIGPVALALSSDGPGALAHFAPRPLHPIEPMLASTAESLAAGFATFEGVALEWKLDGVRIQAHRDGADVRAFSRQLRDVTALVPEIEPMMRALQVRDVILDGEVVASDDAGRPLPFQDLMSRFSTSTSTSTATSTATSAGDNALQIFFFDVLFADGESLVDRPYHERRAVLERIVPVEHRIASAIPPDAATAQQLYDDALARGHEGVMLKSLEAPYAAGRRGAQWLKIKPAVTLDLVILAAEWGHGRRKGLLSNIHLGARIADAPGQFAMLGKTFKGLTDAMLREMTDDLLGIAVERDDFIVRVRPERVVEIAFDAVQRSPRYDSGLALRFARVKRFRPDRDAANAATLDDIRAVQAHRPPAAPSV